MTPRIQKANGKYLVGTRLTMSLANNRTADLWKTFMPRRSDIVNKVTRDLISMRIYKPGHFADFHPAKEFENWAAAEVTDFNNVPDEMETFVVPAGLYAVFDYRGSSNDSSIFQFIFGTWLPGSAYELDDRPHLELLGEKYKNNDPASEEEIWIPIQLKGGESKRW